MHRILQFLLPLLAFASCGKSWDYPKGDSTIVVTLDEQPLAGGSFESGLDGWTLSGDATAARAQDVACHGTKSLRIESGKDYSVQLKRSFSIAAGTYDLTFYFRKSSGAADGIAYVTAGNRSTTLQVCPNYWNNGVVKGIKVDGGQLEVTITAKGNKDEWLDLDYFVISTSEPYLMWQGGDLSRSTEVEAAGGSFKENGTVKPVETICAQNGWNLVRLRLYNDPGNPDWFPSNNMPAFIGWNDVLAMAKRVKAAGMDILLSFHYSDAWSNPGEQVIPHDWRGQSDEQLVQSVYNYTKSFMEAMKAQGTEPVLVSIGNESNAGMLFQESVEAANAPSEASKLNLIRSRVNNMKFFADLVNAAGKAVKEVSPECQTTIHISNAGANYQHVLDGLRSSGAEYDIIGSSYYPYWTGRYASQIRTWADGLYESYGKDVLLLETGYNWAPTTINGNVGQLVNNGPYQYDYPSSPIGQKNYMLELVSEIKKGKHILGYLFWDPVYIHVDGAPRLRDNFNSNATLFDFTGERLPSFDAYKYNK